MITGNYFRKISFISLCQFARFLEDERAKSSIFNLEDKLPISFFWNIFGSVLSV